MGDPTGFHLITWPFLVEDGSPPHSHTHILVFAKSERGGRAEPGLCKGTIQKLSMVLLLAGYWPESSHMTTPDARTAGKCSC